MPRRVLPLTDIQVKHAKPQLKRYKLADGGGMYLEINPTGSKIWRMNYRQTNGKENSLSFGAYLAVSLALAREWQANKADSWKENTAKNVLHRLERDIFPLIGKFPISEVKAPLMLDVLRRIERRGAVEMARRCGQFCGQVFRYAIATGQCEFDPLPALRGALKVRARGHHAAITPDELPEFLRLLTKHEYSMMMQTRIMIRLMLLVFVRTSELTETPWSEIDFDKQGWIIKWHRMKMGKRKINPRRVEVS